MHLGYEDEFLYSRFLLADGVSIDSRTLQPGQMFFALSGSRKDGHTFVEEALKRGASYAVVSEKKYDSYERCLCVKNVLKALQSLARFHRSRYKRRLIAITGSNGKTTTRSLTEAVLSSHYIVCASTSSYNNHIGVPLTLLSILPQTEIAILEIGTSSEGEIASLCEIAQPTHGLITQIGKAHLKGLGSEEGVFREKRALFDFLRKNKGIFYRNSLCKRLETLAKDGGTQRSFPREKDNYSLQCVSTYPRLRYRLPSGIEGEVSLFGSYHFTNLSSAVAVALDLHVPEDKIVSSLANWKPVSQRCEWIERSNKYVLLDSYNANPDSMSAAISSFEEVPKPRVVMLGDMRELGTDSEKEHAAIGQQLAKTNIDTILLCGEDMKAASEEVPQANYFPNKSLLCSYLQRHPLLTGSYVLIKGSRGMAMEDTLPYI